MIRRDVLPAGILLVALVALLTPAARLGVDPLHDGAMLKPALDVLSGQALFRETFMQYGALACYLQVLALWVEPTLLALRLQTVAAYAVTLFFLYAAWRAILPRVLAMVAGVFFILFIPIYEREPWNQEYWMLLPWSSVFAMMFQALGLLALGQVIRGVEAARWSLVLGMACACVFWCRQPVGVTMAGTLLVIWPALHATGWMSDAALRRAVLLRLAGGFALVHTLFLSGMALNGALADWWLQNIVWPARWSQGMVWSETLGLFMPAAAVGGVALLAFAVAVPVWVQRFRPGWGVRFYAGYGVMLALLLARQHDWLGRTLAIGAGGWSGLIPLVIGVQAALSIWQAWPGRQKTRPPEYHLVAATAALSLASLTQYYPMADSWHIFHALAPAFGLFVYSCWHWSGWPAGRMAAVLAVLLLPSLYLKARAIGPALDRPLVTLTEPAVLRGMRVAPEQARFFGQVARVLALAEQIRPGYPAAMIGDNPLYLCLARNQENPVPYYVTWRGLAPPEANTQRWAYIHRVRPLLILQKTRWEAVDEFYRRADYVPVFYDQGEALELALPREMAGAAGLGEYGLFGFGRSRTKPGP
jgi:hypothetical protein